jgi:hypothetical protein
MLHYGCAILAVGISFDKDINQTGHQAQIRRHGGSCLFCPVLPRAAFKIEKRVLPSSVKTLIVALADCLPICLLIQVEKGGKMRKICIRTA